MRRFLFSSALSTGIPIIFSVLSWYVMVLFLGWDQWLALPTCVVVAFFLRLNALKYLDKFLDVRQKRTAEETRHFVTKLLMLYMLIPTTALLGDFLSVTFSVLHPAFVAVAALGTTAFVTSKHLDPLVVQELAEHVRGRILLTFRQAQEQADNYLTSPTDGLFWGGLYLPRVIAKSHFLVQGVTGSGKTLTIRLLMQRVFHWLLREGSDCRALVYDEKCDLYPTLLGMLPESKIVSLNPHDDRCHAWDIAGDVTGEPSALEVSTLLVPGEKADHPYFREAVRTIVSLVMESFAQNSPGEWTLRDVLLTLERRDRTDEVIGRLESGMDRLETVLSKVAALDTGQNINSSIALRLRPFRSIAQSWHLSAQNGRKVSLSDWINGEFVLVVGKTEAAGSASDIINRVLIARAQQLALNQSTSETRETWFFLDEVRGLGRIEGLYGLLNKGRSKGACVVLGFQDFAGMREVYGPNLADEICGQCHQKAFLKVTSTPAAEWASKLIGYEEHIEVDWTKSDTGESQSEHRKTRPLSMTDELQMLPVTGIENPSTGHRNGLPGYYLTELLGNPYRHLISSRELTERLVLPATVPERVPRHEDDLSLSKWTKADFLRLKLNGESDDIGGQDDDDDLLSLF